MPSHLPAELINCMPIAEPHEGQPKTERTDDASFSHYPTKPGAASCPCKCQPFGRRDGLNHGAPDAIHSCRYCSKLMGSAMPGLSSLPNSKPQQSQTSYEGLPYQRS